MRAARKGLGGLPRLDFGGDDTPLQTLPSSGAVLGLASTLYVKRDDRAGPGMGGNKTRKLQYVVAEALRRRCDCLVTAGALQSNHAALTALCGATAGMEVHLVLGGDPGRMRGGNLVIDDLAAARPHFVSRAEWDALAAATSEVTERLRRDGRRPYVIPIGASVPLGAVGYAEAYLELVDQLDRAGVVADWLVTATGSGGTQGGLLAGRALAGRGPRVLGVDVTGGGAELRGTVARLAAGCLELVGSPAQVPAQEVVLVDGSGPGYGLVFEGSRQVLNEILRADGLLLDPVYTSKAMASVASLVGGGAIGTQDTVVFLHTGGLAALFAPVYAASLHQAVAAVGLRRSAARTFRS